MKKIYMSAYFLGYAYGYIEYQIMNNKFLQGFSIGYSVAFILFIIMKIQGA